VVEEGLRKVDVDLDIHARKLGAKTSRFGQDATDDEKGHADGERAGEAALEDGNVLLKSTKPL
jgi:hypothetical protein